MNPNPSHSEHDDAPGPALPPALARALAELRVDCTPARPLWPGIAEATDGIGDRRANAAVPAEAAVELAPALAAKLRALRTPAPPPAALWTDIAARIAEPDERDRLTLSPALRAQLAERAQPTAPARDLWPAIAARTVRRRPATLGRRRSRLTALALAASVVLAFAAVVSIERPLGGPAAVAGPVAATGAGVQTASAERSVPAQAAIVGFSGRGASALRHAAYRPVSPEARGLVRANLQIVRRAEADIEQAIAADPDGAAYLQSLLRSARQQRSALDRALDDPR